MQQTTTKPCLEKAVVKVGDIEIGGKTPVIIAGPCAVESKKQIIESAYAVKRAGAYILRGGAWKPRTIVTSFQGLKKKGLKYLVCAKEEVGLPFVTEVTSEKKVRLIAKYADALQIGARNMQNYELLNAVGAKTDKPVVLKRGGLFPSITNLIRAAEYIASARIARKKEPNVILCLRGLPYYPQGDICIPDYEDVAEIKESSNYPVIFDPSHAVGNGRSKDDPEKVRRDIIIAALDALDYISPEGHVLDGLIVEVHINPAGAKCDNHQQLLACSDQLETIVNYANTPREQRKRPERYLRKEIRLAWEC